MIQPLQQLLEGIGSRSVLIRGQQVQVRAIGPADYRFIDEFVTRSVLSGEAKERLRRLLKAGIACGWIVPPRGDPQRTIEEIAGKLTDAELVRIEVAERAVFDADADQRVIDALLIDRGKLCPVQMHVDQLSVDIPEQYIGTTLMGFLRICERFGKLPHEVADLSPSLLHVLLWYDALRTRESRVAPEAV